VGSVGSKKQYNRQFTNFGPRVGFAYDPTGSGKMVVRAGAGIYYDQPVTNVVTPSASNPPFAASVNNTSNVSLASPFAVPPGGSSSIQAIDPNFKSGVVYSYNFNVQREIAGTVFQVTYVGSQGRHLRLGGDYNQGVNGLRPISSYSSIFIQESVSNSSYNGMWISANKRLSKGFTVSGSLTVAKSIDNNSVGSVGANNPQIQDFHNIATERALSDFDARRRFVLSGIYLLPFKAEQGFLKRLVEGWSVAPIVNMQTGSPFSPIVPLSATLVNAAPVPGTIYNSGSLEQYDRPDYVTGQPLTVPNPSPSQWINPKAFVRHNLGFGSAGRNILSSPGFQDVDFSIAKNTAIRERVSLQFRAEAFNILNHPNFTQPQNSLTATTFGQITATRTPRGDLGSSRQLQLGLKLIF